MATGNITDDVPNPALDPLGTARIAQRLSRTAALVVVFVAVVALVGWIVDVRLLKGATPGQVTVKVNAAFVMALEAVALWLIGRPISPRADRARRLLALVAAAICLVTVAETVLGVNAGIDQWLFHDPDGGQAGRMAPNTAAGLGLMGVVLAWPDLRFGRHRLAGALAAAAGLTGLLAVTGYAAGEPAFYGVRGDTRIALPTALCLVALAGGWAATYHARGAFRLLSAHGPAARSARALIGLALGAPAVLAILRGAGSALGLYGARTSAFLFATLMILVLSAIVASVARALDRSETARQLTERRDRQITDTTSQGFISIDAAGTIRDWNPAAEAMFGWTRGEVLGRRLEETIIPARHRQAHRRGLERLAEEVAPSMLHQRLEVSALHRDGHELEVEVSYAVLRVNGSYVFNGFVEDISERKQAERRFRDLLEASPDALVIVDEQGRIVLVNGLAESLFGYGREQLISKPVEMLIPDRYHDQHEADRDRYCADPMPRPMGARTAELYARHRDGHEFPVEISLSPLQTPDGVLVSSAIRDVTERRHAEAVLREAEERFRSAFEEAPIGMALLDLTGHFEKVNESLTEITGYGRDALEATTFQAITHPDDLAADRGALDRLLSGEQSVYRTEKRYLHASGRPIWVAVQATLIRDPDGRPSHLLSQVQDVDDRRRHEEKLSYLADHDSLTGLLNRRGFKRELDAHAARVRRYSVQGAVLVVDLDHFKHVNDMFGHQAGDDLIARVADLMRGRLRETDALARLGGDEFAALLPMANLVTATLVAQQLVETVSRTPFVLDDDAMCAITASIGVAGFADGEPLTGEDVLVNADLALYDAKDAGRDQVAVLDTTTEAASRTKSRITWAHRIRAALDEGRFTLLAQPIIDLLTGRPTQRELLLRMTDESGDMIPPGAFLYIAERLGLIREVDLWVVCNGISVLARDAGGQPVLPVHINLSGHSICDPRILEAIERALRQANVAPADVTFEITETAAVADAGRARRFGERLRELGCGLALDDFGTGFGTFYYLKHLPCDYLKIDGEFVRNCVSSPTDRLVIQAVVDIAHGLGKRTIAEFVGDDETVRLLTRLGVDYGQGYHLGAPQPLDAHVTNPEVSDPG